MITLILKNVPVIASLLRSITSNMMHLTSTNSERDVLNYIWRKGRSIFFGMGLKKFFLKKCSYTQEGTQNVNEIFRNARIGLKNTWFCA